MAKKTKEPKLSNHGKIMVISKLILGYLSGGGVGCCDKDCCKHQVVSALEGKWTEFDWINMGMQLGVVE